MKGPAWFLGVERGAPFIPNLVACPGAEAAPGLRIEAATEARRRTRPLSDRRVARKGPARAAKSSPRSARPGTPSGVLARRVATSDLA